MFMSGKSSFQRPASPDPELRLFSVRSPPAVAPTPVPKVTVSPAPSPITSHQPTFPSVSTSSSKRHRSPSPSRHRREKSARISPSQQPGGSRSRSHECSSNQPQHHHVSVYSEPRSPSPPPELPEIQSQQPHRPIHRIGPFDDGRDTVVYTEHDPLRGRFVKTTGGWYETRTHYPMPRKHWGRSDSFSPPPGPNRHLQPTRESFKSARGEHDEELRLNQYYWVRNSLFFFCFSIFNRT